MDEKVWAKAEALADRLYAITYEKDTLSNGEQIILLRHPDLPPVKAQGRDLMEAKRNLDDARVDYIYTLLVDGLPVPAPQTSSNNVTVPRATSRNWNFNASSPEEEVEASFGLSFGGDLVKRG
jgi:predicted RNase H-like HicB family nuclease